MEKLLAVIGIVLIMGTCYLLSSDRKTINWKSVGLAFLAQIALAVLMIKTPVWKAVEWVAGGFSWLLAQSTEGINFVFGGLSDNVVFFINSLLPIVYISAIMGLLFHFGIIQKFIKVIGLGIAKIFNIDTIVAVNAVTNMFLGQTESLFITKSYLPTAKDSVIFATLVAGMSSISVSVMGLYTGYGASMEWIVVSIPLTVFSTFVLTQIVMPTEYEAVDDLVVENDKGNNFLDTMMNYANAGFRSVIGISVALMVFISFVYMLNNLLGFVAPWLTVEKILGIIFYPISLLMGVPTGELGVVSELLATRLALNEAVAYGMPQFASLSVNAKAMLTVALCGFAGFGSVGILIGGYSAIAPDKAGLVAKLGMKALVIATFVNILTGAIVGILI